MSKRKSIYVIIPLVRRNPMENANGKITIHLQPAGKLGIIAINTVKEIKLIRIECTIKELI